MSLKYDRIIEMMKEDIPVFRHISLESLKESLQVFRIFELREGEAVNLSGSEVDDYLFVLLGEVEVRNAYDLHQKVTSEDTRERPVLLPKLPGITRVTAIQDAYVVHVDNVLFQHLQILEQSLTHLAADLDVPAEYLAMARETDAFQRLPVESAEKALRAFRVETVAAGGDIMPIQEHGDTFFVLIDGTAELWRQDPDSGLPARVGEFGPGSRFGEDALLTGHEGLEGVKAVTDCTLLALSKGDFDDLVARPLAPGVTPAVAHAMLDEENCQGLDVRYDVEYEMQHIPGAALIMFHELRDKMAELEQGKCYIVYCNGGKLGAAATFTLTQQGYDAVNLEGGFADWKFERAEGMPGEEVIPGEEDDEEELERVEVPADAGSAAAPATSAPGEGGGYHSFVVSDDLVRAAYPQLSLAVNARRMGRRAVVLFTNAGVSILMGDRAGNMGCQVGAAKFAKVMNKFAARTLKREYRERGMLGLDELITLAQAEGVEIFACKTSIEALEEDAAKLIDGVTVIQPEQVLAV